MPIRNLNSNEKETIAMTVRVPADFWNAVCHKLLDEPDMPSRNEFLLEYIEQYASGQLCRRNGEIHRVRQRSS